MAVSALFGGAILAVMEGVGAMASDLLMCFQLFDVFWMKSCLDTCFYSLELFITFS